VFFVGSRAFGVLVLAGLLLAACGDDDDDDVDLEDEGNGTPNIEMTVTAAGDEAGEDEGETTATEEDAAATPEEMEATGTEAEDDAAGTEEEDGAATEDDEAMAGTPTEADDDDATGTESDDDSATGTEDDDDADTTGTEEDDDTDATESDDDDAATEEDDDATGTGTSDDGDTAQIGDAIELGDLTITVEGVSEFMGVPGVIEPDEGQFIAVELTVENAGDEPLSVIDLLSAMHIESADGEEYDADVLANAALVLQDQGLLDQDLDSGGEVSGSIGFDVPSDAEELTLVIESDDDDETVRIDLSEELGS
jgi:hypothetical protein